MVVTVGSRAAWGGKAQGWSRISYPLPQIGVPLAHQGSSELCRAVPRSCTYFLLHEELQPQILQPLAQAGVDSPVLLPRVLQALAAQNRCPLPECPMPPPTAGHPLLLKPRCNTGMAQLSCPCAQLTCSASMAKASRRQKMLLMGTVWWYLQNSGGPRAGSAPVSPSGRHMVL